MKTLNEYMNSLWTAKGRKIFTREYTGVIESVRAKYGKDLEVKIRLPNGSVKLRNGTGLYAERAAVYEPGCLYAERAGVESELGELI